MTPVSDTPIEQLFAHEYRKHAREEYPLQAQVRFETRVGPLFPDFVTEFNGYLIAFECDGREFHNSFRDEVRDALLLGEGHVGTIYHFDGPPIFYSPELCVKFGLFAVSSG
jgi:hypothetical protein